MILRCASFSTLIRGGADISTLSSNQPGCFLCPLPTVPPAADTMQDFNTSQLCSEVSPVLCGLSSNCCSNISRYSSLLTLVLNSWTAKGKQFFCLLADRGEPRPLICSHQLMVSTAVQQKTLSYSYHYKVKHVTLPCCRVIQAFLYGTRCSWW